ncbi:hypothetical protein LH51_15475 [Nitrincola sp. A-D6]|nr:hypothetical protein LH51_15475 [Nitrincola sp. A-D6]
MVHRPGGSVSEGKNFVLFCDGWRLVMRFKELLPFFVGRVGLDSLFGEYAERLIWESLFISIYYKNLLTTAKL